MFDICNKKGDKMGVDTIFKEFSEKLRMSNSTVDNVRMRYKTITKKINQTYYYSSSEISHSLYVGSYGRGTDIFVSDIDIMLPSQLKKNIKNDSKL